MPRLILFVVVAGLVIYGLVWLSLRARDRRAAAAPRRPAPDDDPQFLAQLDQRLREQRRQAERERRRREAEAATDRAADPGTGDEPASGSAEKDLGADDDVDPDGAGDGSDAPSGDDPRPA